MSCLEDLDHQVIVNPGSEFGAEGYLVVDAGFAGVAYVFSDEVAARKGEAEVERNESGTGRDVRTVSNVVIGYMTQREVPDLEQCASGS